MNCSWELNSAEWRPCSKTASSSWFDDARAHRNEVCPRRDRVAAEVVSCRPEAVVEAGTVPAELLLVGVDVLGHVDGVHLLVAGRAQQPLRLVHAPGPVGDHLLHGAV